MHSLHSTTNGSGGTTIVTLGRGTADNSNERAVSSVTVTPSQLAQGGIVTIAGGGTNSIGNTVLTGVGGNGDGTTSIAFTDSEGNIIGTSVIDSATLNGSLGGTTNGSVTVVADGDPNLGSHFLTTSVNSDSEGGINIAKLTSGSSANITLGTPLPVTTISGNESNGSKRSKMEVVDPLSVSAPALEVVVPKPKKGSSVPENEKKVCLWPTGNGTTCGKTFVKFDSLKRHLTEAHKGVRPYACKLCDKTYGRRDYLQRHLKSHNASYATNLTNPGGGRGGAHHNVGNVNAAVAAGAMPQLNFANSNVVQGSRIQVSPTKIKTPSLNNSSSSGSNSQASGVVDLAGGGSVSVILQQGPDGQLTLIQQPTAISSPGSSIVTGPSSNNTPASNNSSPLQTSNTLTSLPFFNLTTSMQPTKPLGSKICRWVQDDGTVCGKAFSKLDSLRRHVNELHKGVRPFACSVCDKNYGRRDYLDRHMKTHDPETQSKRIKITSNTAAGLVDWVVNSGQLKQNSSSGDKGSDRSTTGGKSNDNDSIDESMDKTDNSESGQSPVRVIKKKRRDIPAEEKKICLWVLEDGTACGKTFTKFDSLKRHVSEGHKNVRPFGCTLCGKSYGRRDYLLRHLRSHNEAELAQISAGGSDASALASPSSGNMITINNAGSLNSGNSSNTTSPGGISLSNSIGNGNSPATASSLGGSPNRSIGFLQLGGTPNSSSTIRLPQQPVQQTSTPLSSIGGGISTKMVVSGNNFAVHSGMGRKRSDDKKTCRWVLDNGTICGRSFSKFDSLRRHVQELHKGVRPFVCNLCDKSYGRKDYLDRHMKSHTSTNSDTPSTNTITDVSIDDVKFDSDPVITTSPSLSITNISTAGTTIITTTGSLMTKSDMIGEVDDDDEEMNGPNSSSLDTEGISIEVPQSRVGIVMDDEDENEQNAVVQGVLDVTPPGVDDDDEENSIETSTVLSSHTTTSSSSTLTNHNTRLSNNLTRDHPELTADVVTDDI